MLPSKQHSFVYSVYLVSKQLILPLILVCCFYLPVIAQPALWKSKVSPFLFEQFEKNIPVDFIVVMKDQASVQGAHDIHGKIEKGNYVFETLTSAAASQKEIISVLTNRNISFYSFWIVNALLIKGEISLAEELALRDDVAILLDNTTLTYQKPVYMQSDYLRDITIPWGVDSIHAPAVWMMGIKGAGAVIGGQDTGYEWEHPALKNQYRGWNGNTADHNYNWHDAIHTADPKNIYANPCGIDINYPCDDYGHGTHTMGTMAGAEGDLRIGVAPEAKWIGVRNMEQGWGNLAGYIESFEWFVAPTDTFNLNPLVSMAPHVINNSWICTNEEGCDANNFLLMEEVVKNVKASGIVVVASAGNSGPYCSSINNPPAIFESSFTIGAVDTLLSIASFSSRGSVTVNNSNISKPNVAAPGVDVFSSTISNQYAFSSGTSMAGPHVAGVVALMISANPLLAGDVDIIENIIESTAHAAITNEGCGGIGNYDIPNNTYGWGTVDALAAVQKALLFSENNFNSVVNGIWVYPTMTRDFLWVDNNHQTGKRFFNLYSMYGKQLLSLPLSPGKNMVNLSSLPSGVFLYEIINNQKIKDGKIIIH